MDQTFTLRTLDLTIGYGAAPNEIALVKELSLEAPAGQLIALIGANGSGKSTLLRTLAGLQPALNGEILINGINSRGLSPKKMASELAIVLTERIQSGYLTVGDLVAMGRYPYTDWRGRMQPKDQEASLDALRVTGLENLKHQFLHELSDGQLQKALIGRALAQDGKLMLLDEPLIHLDIPSKWEIMGILKNLANDRGKAIVLATHELELSLQMADHIWLINKQGQMVTGTPGELIGDGTISDAFDSKYYKFDTDRFI